ncbi:YggS family pyridoxal phosphate-dependent enzyme [Desulfobacterota bacterium M19]
MSIEENLNRIRERIAAAAGRAGRDPEQITLVAVSKTKNADMVRQALAAGQLEFGENYLQEAAVKIPQLPDECRWHCIGHIQSNKARLAAEIFDVVETVDRLKIALALERHLAAIGKIMPVYIQVNIGREPQKAGVMPEEAAVLAREVTACAHLRLSGLMAIPPHSQEAEKSRAYFRALRELGAELSNTPSPGVSLGLSMGMSGDFETAIEEGATLVRVGTAIFGGRSLKKRL